MRISLTRSGGLTGLRRSFTVEEDQLSPADRAQFEELLGRAELARLPARLVAAQLQPDRFQYELQVEVGARCQTISLDEAAVPATLAPLLDWLTRHG